MEKQIQAGTIRQQALSALEKSTKLFEIAENLLGQGNKSEAEWVKNEARAQRNISVWLMAKANKPRTEDKAEYRVQYPGSHRKYRERPAESHGHR